MDDRWAGKLAPANPGTVASLNRVVHKVLGRFWPADRAAVRLLVVNVAEQEFADSTARMLAGRAPGL